ncbi:hypothetical protein EJ02DRAFT_294231, partial [Clathrospora elynae]
MDWQPTVAHQGASKKGQAKWVTPEERQRRKDNRLCIQCGGSGHFVKNCPYERPQPPHTSKAGKASVTTTPPVLEEIEDSDKDSDLGKEVLQGITGQGAITQVAKYNMDIEGFQDSGWAYVASDALGFDMILGRPWMDR